VAWAETFNCTNETEEEMPMTSKSVLVPRELDPINAVMALFHAVLFIVSLLLHPVFPTEHADRLPA
jgi:hypothetical protein